MSCACQSKGVAETITPVSPPSTKMKRKPKTNSVGVAIRTRLPAAKVPIQAKTCRPEGTETAKPAAEK